MSRAAKRPRPDSGHDGDSPSSSSPSSLPEPTTPTPTPSPVDEAARLANALRAARPRPPAMAPGTEFDSWTLPAGARPDAPPLRARLYLSDRPAYARADESRAPCAARSVPDAGWVLAVSMTEWAEAAGVSEPLRVASRAASDRGRDLAAIALALVPHRAEDPSAAPPSPSPLLRDLFFSRLRRLDPFEAEGAPGPRGEEERVVPVALLPLFLSHAPGTVRARLAALPEGEVRSRCRAALRDACRAQGEPESGSLLAMLDLEASEAPAASPPPSPPSPAASAAVPHGSVIFTCRGECLAVHVQRAVFEAMAARAATLVLRCASMSRAAARLLRDARPYLEPRLTLRVETSPQ